MRIIWPFVPAIEGSTEALNLGGVERHNKEILLAMTG